ncbi:site-specific integrase [Gordonia hankookensis]|nr:tyrosine-type recombinase/integrase [Gordonia hankookensis]
MTEQKKTRRAEPINRRVAADGTISYWFRVDLGIQPDGRRVRQRHTYPTLKEARAAYRRISTEVASGTHVAPREVTVGEYVTEWLAGRRNVRPNTLAGYRDSLRPVIDTLGDIKLQKLTKAQIDDLVTVRLTSGRKASRPPLSPTARAILDTVTAGGDAGVRYSEITTAFGDQGGKVLDRLREAGWVTKPRRGRYVTSPTPPASESAKGVSPVTVSSMLVLLTAALNDAVDEGLLVRNVARLVERPRETQSEMSTWTREQAAAFREHIRGDRIEALWLLSLLGLRRSEVLGLTWGAVDIEAGTVTIRQARVTVNGGAETAIGEPKSARSRRTLPVGADSEVMTALRSLRATQARERLALGGWGDDRDLVAVDATGTPLRPEAYTDTFRRLAAEAGLPRVRLHDLRHTAASLMLDNGHSPHAVAAWLGHDPGMTLRVYGHVYTDALAAAGGSLLGGRTDISRFTG